MSDPGILQTVCSSESFDFRIKFTHRNQIFPLLLAGHPTTFNIKVPHHAGRCSVQCNGKNLMSMSRQVYKIVGLYTGCVKSMNGNLLALIVLMRVIQSL